MEFADVMERVAIVLEKETGFAPYDKNIAIALNMTPTQYANNKKRNNIPFRHIAEFCAKNFITINWVLYGQSTQKLLENDEEIFRIKHLKSICASAGGGAYHENEAAYEYLYLDKKTAERMGLQNMEHIEAINIVGDSMHPTLKEGSVILLDRNQTSPVRSGIYVVNTLSGLFVKRIALNPNGGVDLISDNANYPVVTVAKDEASIVGKVVGSFEKI